MILAVVAIGGCATSNNTRTIAWECFKSRETANTFARYVMGDLIDFMEATGTGNGKTGLGVRTNGPERCDTGSAAELEDSKAVYTAEEEARFRAIFRDAAIRFRSSTDH